MQHLHASAQEDNVDPNGDPDRVPSVFCEKRCVYYCAGCSCLDILLLVLAIPFIILVPPIGLILAAIAPGAAILYTAYRYCKDQVTVGQMVACCVEVMLWM